MLYNEVMALSITAPSGQQTTTENPQTVPTETPGASAKSSGLQPGTSTNLLTSQQGESLNATPLTKVSFINTGTQTQTGAVDPGGSATPTHHVNAALFSVPVIFCVIAAAMFLVMTRSAKSTTN